MAEMETSRPKAWLGAVLRIGVFAFLAVAGLMIFAPLMMPIAGYLTTSVLSTFGAAAVANAVGLRIFERARMADIGLGWNVASRRNLLLGLAGGAGAAVLVAVVPLATRMAEFRPDPDYPANWPGFAFLAFALLFGAVGEEMLFRGYGFQVLMARSGPFTAILPVSVLFGFAHAGNQNASSLGLANTMLWGVLLGVAFVRSGDLWLPIGLHYGWNVILPLGGVNLSGFRMGVTGYQMHWFAGPLWSGGDYGPEGSLLTTLVVVGLFSFLMRAPIRRQPAYLLRHVEEE